MPPFLNEKQAVVALEHTVGNSVTADANLLEAIIGNLLSNALKYGQDGLKIDISWDK